MPPPGRALGLPNNKESLMPYVPPLRGEPRAIVEEQDVTPRVPSKGGPPVVPRPPRCRRPPRGPLASASRAIARPAPLPRCGQLWRAAMRRGSWPVRSLRPAAPQGL